MVLAQSRVWQAGEQALAAGVQAGMRRGGVLALLPDVRFHERDEAAETVALEALALALLRFGPDVAIAASQCVVIDVGPSLRLFGGLTTLCTQVLDSAEALGHRATLGIAATASAAALLARAERAPLMSDVMQDEACVASDDDASVASRREMRDTHHAPVNACTADLHTHAIAQLHQPSPHDLPAQLDTLSVALLAEAQPWLDWLAQIGCATLGELRALPGPGIRRRCGAQLPAALERAYGEQPEAPAWYRAPPHFEAVLPLPSLTGDVEILLFGLRRLLAQLTGWLGAGQLATRALTLVLEHEPMGRHTLAPTRFDIALAEPSAAPAHLLSLCKERLARQPLVAPVLTLRLDVTQTADHVPQSGSLLPEPGRARQDFVQLMERFAARLGDERVMHLEVRGDHRPEAAFARVAYGNGESAATKPAAKAKASTAGRGAEAAARATTLPASASASRSITASHAMFAEGVSHGAAAASRALAALPARPAWLLDAPQRLDLRHERPWRQGPLQLLAGPERIEAGWWEVDTVTRDYFIASDPTGALLWIFRERPVHGASATWYLHGLFG